jgi:hypothetical protein
VREYQTAQRLQVGTVEQIDLSVVRDCREIERGFAIAATFLAAADSVRLAIDDIPATK